MNQELIVIFAASGGPVASGQMRLAGTIAVLLPLLLASPGPAAGGTGLAGTCATHAEAARYDDNLQAGGRGVAGQAQRVPQRQLAAVQEL